MSLVEQDALEAKCPLLVNLLFHHNASSVAHHMYVDETPVVNIDPEAVYVC